MKSRPALLHALGAIVVCALCVVSGRAQVSQQGSAGPVAGEKPLMAEQVFTNVQVLKGLSVTEFMETMGFFAASLNANCTTCHELGSWESYAIDNPEKQMARKMVLMMNSINQTYFGGKGLLTCYSCHRFGRRPKVVPDLDVQYGAAPDEDLDEIRAQAPGQPTPDQVLDKYFKALGGAEKLADLTSFIVKGTWQGYEDTEQHSLEIYAKAPSQLTTIVNNHGALTTNTFDGLNGWVVAPDTDVPVTSLSLSGSDLDNAKVEAQLSFPAQIKQILADLRVGVPFTIDGKDVTILQGYSPAKSPVKLYFDSDTGLLVRIVEYMNLKVGREPVRIDYSDYRDVNGIKVPFHRETTWTDGRSKTQIVDVQLNASIDAAKFARPLPPPAAKSTIQ